MFKALSLVLSATLLFCVCSFNEAFAQDSKRLDDLEARMDAQDEKLHQILEILTQGQSGGTSTPGAQEAAATPQKAPPVATSPDEYTPGWILRIYSLPKGFDVTADLPPTELGSAEATKSTYDFRNDASQLLGIAVNSYTMWRGEGFLLVSDQGYYTFVVNIHNRYSNSYGAIRVDGKEIATSLTEKPSGQIDVIGGAALNPGLHTVELRAASGLHNDLTFNGSVGGSFAFSIKSPDDSSPRPAHEVLLKKIKK